VAAHSGGPGHGSEFTLRLPLLEIQRQPAPRAVPPEPAPMASAGLRVLIVDDNRDAADMLAQVLRSLGHETRTAYDALQALEVAAAYHPSHALLDIGLPILDGYELARRLREQAPAIVLIAVTGYGQESDRRRAREAGFLDHLVKPVDLDALSRLLAAYIPRRSVAST